MKKILLLLAISATIVSCGSSNECKDCDKKKDDVVKDTIVDSFDDAVKRDTSTARTKEQQINHEKIVKKFGEQWDFCKCVLALDSLDDAVENSSNLTDSQAEKLMARFEHVDKKCKEITTFDQTTPDERAKHDKKVEKCLKAAGKRK